MVGKAFCDDYKEVNIQKWYYDSWSFNEHGSEYNAVADGNIQARLRMIYLYNLAGIHKGLVMDTDNLTENNLGYFTIHGDVGDFNPIGGLWKTEVFKLAEWISKERWKVNMEWLQEEDFHSDDSRNKTGSQAIAIAKSLALKPTAGLGITDSDLDEIGAESYDQVDRILQCLTDNSISTDTIDDIPDAILEAVVKRHNASKFKRKQLPIKIERDGILV